ncbi:MAG: DUF1385 domain-containing protein [Clostridia bacterium]|nr:DUF1385 domain-containing protein [Clostridia bacterium]
MKKLSIGGQALIEGIMMKSPKKTAMAVRTPDRSIDIEYIEEKHIKDKIPFLGWPILRGVVNFVESMILGYKTLMKSADKSGMTDLEEAEELERKKAKEEKKRQKLIAKGKLLLDEPLTEAVKSEAKADETPDVQGKINGDVEIDMSAEEKPEQENGSATEEKKKSNSALITSVMILGVVLGVVMAIGLFIYLPTATFNGIKHLSNGAVSDRFRPLIEGVLKIAIFVGYVALTSLTKDIKRVFMYHGAEHKTIFCLENELPLTVENVKKQSRFHPRCGTSFMILMLVVGIVISFLIVTFFPEVTKITALWVAIKILIVPLICGIGYELIKFCGKHNNIITRIISAPGMWVQRLTTKEPEDDMIEVAIAAIEAVLPEDADELKGDGCCPDLQ